MAERVVTIRLQALADGAVRGFHAVRDAAAETKAKVNESARSQREEWATVGAGLTAVGVVVTGLGVAVLKTGIAYNTLQQTSRAALTTLLGSAEAANVQMNKLDEFARNSPFAKQVFIQAQQQMLAFGIETRKVLPYLDAVQNAVAAMGGSNQQISEIVSIMSKIQSSAKITAVDLMQFGNNGVDAAALIGSQMNKTAGQIREDITAGSLDAGKALDALAAGMQARFGGAAANVKNTFAGAMDRVSAAWRDFSAELAKPLVDPNGGGALVDLLNWAADMMRAFQKLPEPVKLTISALTGLVGVSALLGGTFMLGYPKLLAFKDALAGLGTVGPKVLAGLNNMTSFLTGPWGIAIAAAAAAVAIGVTVINASIDRTTASASDLVNQFQAGGDAIDRMAQKAESSNWFDSIFAANADKLRDLPALLDEISAKGEGAAFWWNNLNASVSDAATLKAVVELGQAFGDLAATDLAAAQRAFRQVADEQSLSYEQTKQLLEVSGSYVEILRTKATELGMVADEETLMALAMGEIDIAAEENKRSLEGVAGVAVDTTDAISKLASEIINFGKAQIDADRAAIALQDKLSKLAEIMDSGSASLGVYTGAGRETEAAMLDVAEAAKKQAESILLASGNQDEANAVLDEARQRLIDSRTALDGDAAAAEAWAASRVPTAEQVRQRLDEVTAAAEGIPGDTGANVHTDAPGATGLLNQAADAANSIPGSRDVTVRAHVQDAINSLNGLLGTIARIPGNDLVIRAVTGNANGGTVGFARGGTVPGAASGWTVGAGGGVAAGTVYGQGTSKSDSIMVRLSRGEEVIQEPYASMNRGLLKAINRGELHQGSLRPQVIQVQGAPGETRVMQDIDIVMMDRDPRLVARQLGRELKGALG